MTGHQLRNSILQEAIQGRLVPSVLQPGEKTGAELLQDILAERQKKENKEKGKKAKRVSLSTIEEEPWAIPEGWCWCRLGDVGEFTRGKGIKKDEVTPEGFPCVRYGELYTRYRVQFSSTFSRVNEVVYNKSQKIENGDVVMALTGENEYDIALASVYLGTTPVAMGGDMTKLHPFIDSKYLVYVINSPYGIECKSLLATGQIIVHISNDKLASIQIPLPPLSVQKAIVSKIEELFPLVDEYEKAAVELNALNEILPDKLRKSVLQEAIHGNLVSNDIPEGEATASELLQQILKERQDRENKAKGKKAKKLSLSTIEEEPWNLPEGWCWTQIGDIFDHSAGKSLNSSKQSIGKIYPYLTTSNVYWDGINFEKVKEMAFTEEEYKKCSAIKNDILVCEGGDVGRSCIWTYDYTIGLQNHVHRLRAIKNVDVNFFYFVLRFYKANGIITAKGIGIGGFSANALKGLSVPLPPLSIQHRIVKKIEEVFAAIDKLQV